MQASDKAEFTAELSRLCDVFDKRVTPDVITAYWQALNKQSMGGFRKACERALETCERMPRPSQLWTLYREEMFKASKPVKMAEEVAPQHYDDLHILGQRAFSAFLIGEGPFEISKLDRLVEAKNRIISQFRLIASEESVANQEVINKLKSAWRAIQREREAA